MVKLEKVKKQYKDFELDCSMEIKEGWITGLVGQNGAGKSTAFKAMLGLIRSDSGKIEILGKTPELLGKEEREQIGVVMAGSGFNGYLSINDLVPILGAMYQKFDKTWFLKGCEKFKLPFKKKIKEFSTGMNRKLQILAALSHDAKLLVLDEPTAGLDVVAREQILDMLREYMEMPGRSILISSHISSDLEGFCDDLYMIDNGKIILHEETDRLLEEFLEFILSIRRLKEKNDRLANNYPMQPRPEVQAFLEGLPFELTGAQKKVWKEIEKDLGSDRTMSRLVQGDVGSGKTIVAVLALMNAAFNGYQGAMMAPTEVLARQHYENITKMFEDYDIPVKVELLTGSMTAKEKRRAYDRIECGLAKIIIGTHALIQGAVSYDNLGLVITDEQHRFGVKQRETFALKGGEPHVLVMSATPIPRTLAIILYGDLDISVIDELPANRLPIKNCVVDTSCRNTAYNFMKKQIAEGRQCYVICPMVEESETMEAENVTDYTVALQEEMGDQIQVACLHGKMKQVQKDDIMDRFGKNEIQILVSTTVIEVGIDVPNATVMMIENAERFGLAQLHQLRGRVGRGKYQSYCIFMSASKSKETKERLDILNHSNDGFKIASEDLRLRGPGDLFGIRQSGLMNFRLGDVYQDAKILQMANEAADQLTAEDEEWIRKLPNYESAAAVVI